ncbi:hypothetical protein H696_00266 [Fonticula alba]|uniref:Uncharacterized protein n=1 Tax=Fonticula alba TaxID=691883 RepID=A0A058ZGR9_FONAL|nr:hypothetical protein H696_00266 [Fonticula alba]KCV72687.1 hypothetical protein H696_00266 [Fonticula alba]|eukprot:XP_009492388.1 hypothetical protein H696_00266 [Fonticula alba]
MSPPLPLLRPSPAVAQSFASRYQAWRGLRHRRTFMGTPHPVSLVQPIWFRLPLNADPQPVAPDTPDDVAPCESESDHAGVMVEEMRFYKHEVDFAHVQHDFWIRNNSLFQRDLPKDYFTASRTPGYSIADAERLEGFRSTFRDMTRRDFLAFHAVWLSGVTQSVKYSFLASVARLRWLVTGHGNWIEAQPSQAFTAPNATISSVLRQFEPPTIAAASDDLLAAEEALSTCRAPSKEGQQHA